MAEVIECPVCSKKSVVQRKENLYHCLACNFHRDFSESPKSESKSDNAVLWVGLIAALVAFWLLQAISPVFNLPKPAVKSSAAPTATQDTTYMTLNH